MQRLKGSSLSSLRILHQHERRCACVAGIPHFRAFHSSSHRRIDLLVPMHSALQTLHSTTGLAWSAVIPLSAIFVRSAVYYFITRKHRYNLQIYMDLMLVKQAWQAVFAKQIMTNHRHEGPIFFKKEMLKRTAKKELDVNWRWGLKWYWRFMPILQLPPFIMAIETIRRMAGMPEGIFGWLTGWTRTKLQNTDGVTPGDGNSAPVGATTSPPEDVVIGSNTSLDSSLAFGLEPSFATEGALWFPNLLLPDPTFTLPMLVSASLLSQIAFGAYTGQQELGFWKKMVTRGLTLFSLGLFVIILEVPSAVLLYWVTSSGFGLLQTVLLHYIKPLRLPPLASKRTRASR